MFRKLKELIDGIKSTREDHNNAMQDYFLYKAIMANAPALADDQEIECATNLLDNFNNAITIGEEGEQLTKRTRFLLYIPLVMIELAILCIGMFTFEKYLPVAWGNLTAVALTILSAILLDIVFLRWIYNPIGRLALKKRIRRLSFWTDCAKHAA